MAAAKRCTSTSTLRLESYVQALTLVCTTIRTKKQHQRQVHLKETFRMWLCESKKIEQKKKKIMIKYKISRVKCSEWKEPNKSVLIYV